MNPTAILPSCYLPPIAYVSMLMRYEQVIIDVHERYVKQTYRNRCRIASPNGPIALSIPVTNDSHSSPMTDVKLSGHGNWKRVHLAALDSYYRHTPYYDYYRDDFANVFEQHDTKLVPLNTALLKLICELMGITPRIELSTEYVNAGLYPGTDDYRNIMSPKVESEHVFNQFKARPYYQLFSERNGFIPNLSCIDLLFNMGPESPLWL